MASKKAATTKGGNKKKTPADHPRYIEMISAAVQALKDRKGSSRQAISKYVKANYKVGENHETHLKLALKRAANAGTLVHSKGIGANGSFKLPPSTKPTPAAKKPAKKTATKKTTEGAKAKTPKKAVKPKTKAKSPAKKAATKKRPAAAAKSPKKAAAAPKKTKKSPAKPKKTATKKPAAKKTASKKAAAKK